MNNRFASKLSASKLLTYTLFTYKLSTHKLLASFFFGATLLSVCLNAFAQQPQRQTQPAAQRPRRAATTTTTPRTATPKQTPKSRTGGKQQGNQTDFTLPPSELPPPPPPAPRPTPTPAAAAPPVKAEIIEDDSDVINVVSKLVVVPVSVSDAQGKPVLGLTTNDFRIEEKGKPQQITNIGDAEEIPLELALLIDVSGSVQGRFDFELEAAARFLKQVMKPADRVTLFAIDTVPRRLGERLTADEAVAQLRTVRTNDKSATAFFDTVSDAAEFLAKQTPARTRRVIVCLSDGDDTYSERLRARFAQRFQQGRGETEDLREQQAKLFALMLQTTLPEVQRADAVFYAINPSGNSIYLNVAAKRGQEGLREISSITGGSSFLPNVLEDLDVVFNQITTELRAQYLLQYYSNNTARSGEYLPITVRAANPRPNTRLRARQGYYSK